jgi:hypothetical protein
MVLQIASGIVLGVIALRTLRLIGEWVLGCAQRGLDS